MNAAVLIGILLLIGAGCFIAGVTLLWGAGWALLTGGACAVGFGTIIARGRPSA